MAASSLAILVVTLLSTATTTAALPTNSSIEARAAGFLNSCRKDYIEVIGGNMLLSSECHNDRGDSASSRLDLNHCLANWNGKLFCAPHGDFFLT